MALSKTSVIGLCGSRHGSVRGGCSAAWLAPDQLQATVRLTEEDDLHDPLPTEDLTLDFANGYAWQKRITPCGQPAVWDVNNDESPLTGNPEGAEPVLYRDWIHYHR